MPEFSVAKFQIIWQLRQRRVAVRLDKMRVVVSFQTWSRFYHFLALTSFTCTVLLIYVVFLLFAAPTTATAVAGLLTVPLKMLLFSPNTSLCIEFNVKRVTLVTM